MNVVGTLSQNKESIAKTGKDNIEVPRPTILTILSGIGCGALGTAREEARGGCRQKKGCGQPLG
jgi:hypothetical protein